MEEINYTLPIILRDEAKEESLGIRTDTLEDLRQCVYMKENDETMENEHKNKELRKKISDLDHSLRIASNLTRHLQQKNEELDSEIDQILWSQNRAKLSLASQQRFRCGINHTMEQHVTQIAHMGNEAGSSDRIFEGRQDVIEKINSMKAALEKRKKEIEQNEFHANKIKQETLIVRKRNQAMLIRLSRQHQEAKFRHHQVLEKLTSLRDRLKKNTNNIGQDKLDN